MLLVQKMGNKSRVNYSWLVEVLCHICDSARSSLDQPLLMPVHRQAPTLINDESLSIGPRRHNVTFSLKKMPWKKLWIFRRRARGHYVKAGCWENILIRYCALWCLLRPFGSDGCLTGVNCPCPPLITELNCKYLPGLVSVCFVWPAKNWTSEGSSWSMRRRCNTDLLLHYRLSGRGIHLQHPSTVYITYIKYKFSFVALCSFNVIH